MSKCDFHSDSFDEGTILKLSILKDYIKSWIPVFVHNNVKKINIFDFQCGPGLDIDGNYGSPFCIIDSLRIYSKYIDSKKIIFNVIFNDIDGEKVDRCKEYILSNSLLKNVTYTFDKLDFNLAFNKYLHMMKNDNTANFIFMDPTGLLPYRSVIAEIAKIPRTDFLLFTPAQQIAQFCSRDEFKKYLPDFHEKIKVKNFSRIFCEYIRKSINVENYYLVPFSIKKKKNTNIYALIFGSKEILGLDKFLDVAWSKSPNGEANYDLIGDFLFSEQAPLPFFKESEKIKKFQNDLYNLIMCGKMSDSLQIAMFAWENGFIPQKHAKLVLKRLHDEGLIAKVPGLSYSTIIRNNKVQKLIFLNKSNNEQI